MIKLICIQCNTIWYTCSTKDNQKCDKCNGELKEIVDTCQDMSKVLPGT